MSKHTTTKILSGAIIAIGALAGFGIASPAQAGQLHEGWNYSIDSFSDGSGGSTYDYKGLAFTQTADKIIFALSSGLGYDEESSSNLTHGDLILNFSPDQSVKDSNGSLLAIKFATKEDNTNIDVGVYKDVTAGDINDFADINHAGHNYDSLDHYYDFGWNKTNTFGTDLATKEATYNYFYDITSSQANRDNTSFYNAIESGTKIGDIAMLDKATLDTDYGLDFENFNAVGSDVFGFSLDKSMLEGVLPGGINEFMAHVILECGNDGVALAVNDLEVPEEDVPEPTTFLGLGALGLLLSKGRKRQAA